jgi:hypothetical protein
MRPRHAADYRTLLWLLAMPLVAFVQYRDPSLVEWMWPVSCYFALAAGVIAHNHNHAPTLKSKRANAVFANWISVFYGYPTFAWVPTHNLNHHKLVNKAGDATITWRYTNSNNALVAFTYFFVSSYFQSGPIREYMKKAKATNRRLYRTIVTQYSVFVLAHVSLLVLAIAWHGPLRGLYVFGLTFAVPAFFALWTIMLFNYIQHVHADPWSRHDHSRSFWWWCAKHLILSIAIPSWRTQQIGRAPFDPPGGEKVVVETAGVDALDAGTNAQMV